MTCLRLAAASISVGPMLERPTSDFFEAMNIYRFIALAVAAVSAAAMLYVGLYQGRFVGRLICPVFADGCEGVADAPFARPFGIPDGYIGTVLYGAILVLLLAPTGRWIGVALLVLSS